VAQDEYEKESAADFALWKAWDESDGEVFWDQYPDLGKGRPGWHIECSAMSIQYLGQHFDLHTGGVDNIFPHHQNEIAQAEPCTGQTFVNYWLHSEHLQVESRKMSKSEGNFFTLRDLLAADGNPSGRAWDPMAVRYLLLATHYRSRVDFTFKSLQAAGDTRQGLLEFLRRCLRQQGTGPVDPEVAEELQQARQAFVGAMDEDLNTPEALAALHSLRHEINRCIDESSGLGAASGRAVVDLVLELDQVLGLRLDEALARPDLAPEELAMIEERQAARRARDFARADGLRQELEDRGIRLEDTPQGVTWKIDPSRR
jgi:cysteinyl-tRNA synthetase